VFNRLVRLLRHTARRSRVVVALDRSLGDEVESPLYAGQDFRGVGRVHELPLPESAWSPARACDVRQPRGDEV